MDRDTVVLHWLNGQGSYKQFVANRVNRILEKRFSKWNYRGSMVNGWQYMS